MSESKTDYDLRHDDWVMATRIGLGCASAFPGNILDELPPR